VRDEQPPTLFSPENLVRQYEDCRRHKRNTVNALRFEARQELNLLALRDALAERSYEPGRSVCFSSSAPSCAKSSPPTFATAWCTTCW
jgi:hypothetical protein